MILWAPQSPHDKGWVTRTLLKALLIQIPFHVSIFTHLIVRLLLNYWGVTSLNPKLYVPDLLALHGSFQFFTTVPCKPEPAYELYSKLLVCPLTTPYSTPYTIPCITLMKELRLQLITPVNPDINPVSMSCFTLFSICFSIIGGNIPKLKP